MAKKLEEMSVIELKVLAYDNTRKMMQLNTNQEIIEKLIDAKEEGKND